MEIPSIKTLIAGGIKGIGEAAKGVIDSINAPKEEKIKAASALEQALLVHEEAMVTQANELQKAFLADIDSARKSNEKIQDSANASFLSKNVAYMIDLFVTALWGGLTGYLMAVMLHLAPKQAGVDYTAVTAVWGAVTGVFTQVLSFHRGSSQGSADKQKTLDKMNTRVT